MNNILITMECVADLPLKLYQGRDTDIIYYDIKTDSGIFRDTTEVDSQNIMDYMLGGEKKAISVIPTANEFKSFFSKGLKEYDQVLHICISSGISEAYSQAMLARAKMGNDGNRVFVVDSKQLSSGQGLVILEAIRCRDEGMGCKEIAAHLEEYVTRVSTTFLTNNADYLYYNGKVKKLVMNFCKTFHLHPVLAVKEGRLVVRNVYIGDYDRVAKKYIKSVLANPEKIDKKHGFITYAGCRVSALERVSMEISEVIAFENVYIQQASATVSCNCGPKTFGILFARNE